MNSLLIAWVVFLPGAGPPAAAEDEPVVSELVGRLKDSDYLKRRSACDALVRAGADAVPALTRALSDPDRLTRVWAARALLRIDPRNRPAVRALVAALDARGDVYRDATDALAGAGPAAREAAPKLLKRMKDADPVVRVEAAFALWKIDRNPDRALPVFLQVLRDPEQQKELSPAWQEASAYLEGMGKDARTAVPALLELLRTAPDSVRANVAGMLCALEPEPRTAVPALVKALGDKLPLVRGNAAVALGHIGKPARPALPALRKQLRDGSELTRVQTAAAVWRIDRDAKATLPVLLAALKSEKDVMARALAIDVLGRMASPAKEAVPALLGLLDSTGKDGLGRRSILSSLQAIDPGAVPKGKGRTPPARPVKQGGSPR